PTSGRPAPSRPGVGQGLCMTTDTTPADHGRPALGVADPAELLAQTRLSLGGPPTDRLILAGRAAAGTAAMITSSPLRELLGPRGRSSLRHHLALMRERGTEGCWGPADAAASGTTWR